MEYTVLKHGKKLSTGSITECIEFISTQMSQFNPEQITLKDAVKAGYTMSRAWEGIVMNAQQLIDLEMSYEKASGLLAAAIAWRWSEADIDRQRELCKQLYRQLAAAGGLVETYHGLEYIFDHDGIGWYWTSDKDESQGVFRTLGDVKDDAKNWLGRTERACQEDEQSGKDERLAYYQSRL